MPIDINVPPTIHEQVRDFYGYIVYSFVLHLFYQNKCHSVKCSTRPYPSIADSVRLVESYEIRLTYVDLIFNRNKW